ncbi:MAG TPA: extracellular solute-binding protein [Anaerolineales bacterium]|nr:extracellular solute-binding protein [Anaerolineales bacterium]
MTTIDFSLIPDADGHYESIQRLMSSFRRETGIDVNLKRMEWENAWPQLISISTQGQGADISHVGSTWVSSLMTMNALRPIPAQLISKVGGDQAFVHSTWSNVVAEEDRFAYGLPFSAYVYIVAYRKDLLKKAGLNGSTAFATPHALEESVQRLGSLNETEVPWLMPIVPHPFNDLVHMAASWIWSSGGHIMDNRGKQILINSPAALAGLKSFLRLLRNVPNDGYLGADMCMEALLDGKAAAVVTDVASLLNALQNQSPKIENIGAASLMSIPWSGGGSIVIWRHTYGYPDRLEASYKLAEFLVRKHSMLELANQSNILPARTDALDELFPPNHILRPVMLQLISTGRSYRPIALWHRIEHQFGVELGEAANTLLKDPDADLDTVVTQTMNSLADRLNLTLE